MAISALGAATRNREERAETPGKGPMFVNADDDDETGASSSDRLSYSVLSKFKPDLDALHRLEGADDKTVMDRLFTSNDGVRRLLAEPVSQVKAANNEGAKTIKEVKSVAIRAAQDAVRKHSQAHAESEAIEVPKSVFHDILKGEFMAAGPHKFAFPVLFPTLEAFIASLWTSDLEFWKTWRRWAMAIDSVLELGAAEFVKRCKALADERCDDGVIFGWRKQHIIDVLVHFVYIAERKFKLWLRQPASSSVPLPRFREFESWQNSKETLDTHVRTWNSPGQIRPGHLPKQRTDSGALKSWAPAALDGSSEADLVLTEKIRKELPKLLKASGGASGGGGSGAAPAEKPAKGRKAAAPANAAPAAKKPAAAARKPSASARSESVCGVCRSSRKFIDLIRDPKTKAVIDKHSILRKGSDNATCAGWMFLDAGCSCDVGDDGACQFGAHFVTDDTESEAATLVRDLAKAEGRDASSFRGFGDGDFKP